LTRFKRVLVRSALGVTALALGDGSAQADGGALDPAFGDHGIAITPVAGGADLLAVAVQPDGRIVAGGHIGPPGAQLGQFLVERYNPDGSLDQTFGTAGMVTTDLPGGQATVRALAIQPDGKIIAVGSSFRGPEPYSFTGTVLVRYNVNGSLDPSFGNGGIVGGSDAVGGEAHGVVLQPDGKALVVSGSEGLALSRFNPDGSLDASFSGGVVSLSLTGFGYGAAIGIQADGKILAAGDRASLDDPDHSVFLLARFQPDGSLDTSFGSGGLVTTNAGESDRSGASALALQQDEKIVLGGQAQFGSQDVSALIRYSANGVPDDSFGDHGVVLTAGENLGYVDAARTVLLQPDRQIVAVGNGLAWGWGFGLTRYLPDGSLDPAFGDDGIVTTTWGVETLGIAGASALQPDGKIVVVGYSWPSSGPLGDETPLIVARYLTDNSHQLTLHKTYDSGNGAVTSSPAGIGCDSGCLADAAQFADQSLVTLTAHPLAGAAVTWTGACAGSKNACTVTMQQGAQSVHVSFFRCVVPRLKGRRLTTAKKAIRHAHCSVGRTTSRFSRKVAKGRVISQSPRRGRTLPAHSKVKLVVSKGRA